MSPAPKSLASGKISHMVMYVADASIPLDDPRNDAKQAEREAKMEAAMEAVMEDYDRQQDNEEI